MAVESYVDKLSIGLCCDPDAVPDLDGLRRGVAETLRELSERATAEAAAAGA